MKTYVVQVSLMIVIFFSKCSSIPYPVEVCAIDAFERRVNLCYHPAPYGSTYVNTYCGVANSSWQGFCHETLVELTDENSITAPFSKNVGRCYTIDDSNEFIYHACLTLNPDDPQNQLLIWRYNPTTKVCYPQRAIDINPDPAETAAGTSSEVAADSSEIVADSSENRDFEQSAEGGENASDRRRDEDDSSGAGGSGSTGHGQSRTSGKKKKSKLRRWLHL